MSTGGMTESTAGDFAAYWIEAETEDGPWRIMWQLPGQGQATAQVPPCAVRRLAEERARAQALAYARRVNTANALGGQVGAEVVTLKSLPLWCVPLDRERDRFCFVVRGYTRERSDHA